MSITSARLAAESYITAVAARDHLLRTLPDLGSRGRTEAVRALGPVTRTAATAFREFLIALADLKSAGLFEAASDILQDVLDRTRTAPRPIEEVFSC